MIRVFISFSLLVLIVLSSIGGCGNGGNNNGMEPEPSPEPSEACPNCPCDMFSVPMTPECWDSPQFIIFNASDKSCLISNSSDNVTAIVVILLDGSGQCSISVDQNFCNAPDFTQGNLSDVELSACWECLEQYTKALNNADISVSGGPPYICPTPFPH